jgi:hypothetical protein
MSRIGLAAAGLGSRNVKLADEFEHAFRSLAWMRECLEQELAYDLKKSDGQHVIDNATLSKWSSFVKTLDVLAAAKVRYDKNAQAHADSMTPAEELEAVRSYVRALEPRLRLKFLEEEAAWHGENVPLPVAR